MSWGEYLKNLKSEGLKHAAICGSDGASWIQVSEGAEVSAETPLGAGESADCR